MKKFAVIAAMVLLSVATMTACGNKKDKQGDNNQTNVADNQNDNQDDSQDTNDGDNSDNTEDTNNTEDNTEPNSNDNQDNDDNTDNDNTGDNDNKGDTSNDQKNDSEKPDDNSDQPELVETGEQPDFKLNDKGCFNGSYEGNDGCIYKFTKKGKLIITSDTETMKYEYTLNGDVLVMIAADGSFGTSRQITLLEDGTYLLDDTMGTQVILTYIES